MTNVYLYVISIPSQYFNGDVEIKWGILPLV